MSSKKREREKTIGFTQQFSSSKILKFLVRTVISGNACSAPAANLEPMHFLPSPFLLIKECPVILSHSWWSLSLNWTPCNLLCDAHECAPSVLFFEDSRATQKIPTLRRQNRFPTTNKNGDLGWGQWQDAALWVLSSSAVAFSLQLIS